MYKGGVFQKEETAGTKVLRQVCAWHIEGGTTPAMWLKPVGARQRALKGQRLQETWMGAGERAAGAWGHGKDFSSSEGRPYRVSSQETQSDVA